MNTCMLKNRKSQLSITMIITAIIGLIILVVIVLMLTGNLGAFGAGVSEAGSCANTCNGLGSTSPFQNYAKDRCKGPLKYLGTGFDDAPNGCCCVFP